MVLAALTSRPKETRFRREVPVPGVKRILLSLVGDLVSSGIVCELVAASGAGLTTRSVLFGFILVGGWPSVAVDWPQMAFLMARAAKTGAGVSGASNWVVSSASH